MVFDIILESGGLFMEVFEEPPCVIFFRGAKKSRSLEKSYQA